MTFYDSFENMRSLNQDLTFNALKKEFDTRKIPFGQPQKQTLGLITSEGIYTNLGLLLSDQCTHNIKAAVFQETDQAIFKDRREFAGSLMQQMNEVYSYIDFHNQTKATFDRLRRVDKRDYPEIAVREALLNLLVHRDYSFSAAGMVSIYADRIEFISIGGLVPGISPNDITMGISVCRNPHLANIFYRLELIEAYGTGLQKIMSAYKGQPTKPKIETSDNAFKIILPNINYEGNKTPYLLLREDSIDDYAASSMQKILDYLRENNVITRADVEQLLEVSTATAYRYLKRMTQEGLLVEKGNGKNRRYSMSES